MIAREFLAIYLAAEGREDAITILPTHISIDQPEKNTGKQHADAYPGNGSIVQEIAIREHEWRQAAEHYRDCSEQAEIISKRDDAENKAQHDSYTKHAVYWRSCGYGQFSIPLF